MSRILTDGEQRKIRYSPYVPNLKNFAVEAICVDSDTPLVKLSINSASSEVHLTDVEAEELIRQLQKALKVLPSSK